MEYYIDPVTFVTQKSGFESRYIKNLLGLLDEGPRYLSFPVIGKR